MSNSKLNNYEVKYQRLQELLRLLCDGSSQEEIADKLNVSYATIKRDMQYLFRAYDAVNSNNLVYKYAKIENIVPVNGDLNSLIRMG